MSKPARDSRGRSGSTSPQRAGVVSVMLLVAVLCCLGMLGLAIELSWLYLVQDQLQTSCDAAALAGAAELMDRSVLKPGARRDLQADIDRAYEVARDFAADNRVAGASPELVNSDTAKGDTANGERATADDDLSVGWLDDPTNRLDELEFWPHADRVNTMRVRELRSCDRNSAVRLHMSKLLGLGAADLRGEAWASIDGRVYGFRPAGKNAVMVSPIAAQSANGSEGWLTQTGITLSNDNDNFQVDEKKAEVRSGQDGIPEITIRMPLVGNGKDGEIGTAVVLLIGPMSHSDQSRAREQFADGLKSDDLAENDGQFALNDKDVLPMPGMAEAVPAWTNTLMAERGRPRIWPMFQNTSGTDTNVLYDVAAFAAGCIVDATIDDQGWLNIVVQPTTIVTSQALVRPLKKGQKANRLVAKLALTH